MRWTKPKIDSDGKLCPNCDGKIHHSIDKSVGMPALYRCPKCKRL